jgi:hypothetical protein
VPIRLGGYLHTLVHKRILCLRVGGNWDEWPVGHVDGHPAIRHLQTDSIKSVEAPLYPYIRILTVEFMHTTLFLMWTSRLAIHPHLHTIRFLVLLLGLVRAN